MGERSVSYFDMVWYWLAKIGYCDSPGGAEHRRVRAEWLKKGRPPRIIDFITRYANRTGSKLASRNQPKPTDNQL